MKREERAGKSDALFFAIFVRRRGLSRTPWGQLSGEEAEERTACNGTGVTRYLGE
ncbi:MAG: hypothetical protein ACI30O_05925 [Muribaculaceae bacterium]